MNNIGKKTIKDLPPALYRNIATHMGSYAYNKSIKNVKKYVKEKPGGKIIIRQKQKKASPDSIKKFEAELYDIFKK